MKERLKKLRKELNLSQQELADKIGVKRGSVANYEIGRNEPIDAVINSICREFDVNESWLREGKGEMFVLRTRDEEIANFIGSIQCGDDNNFKKRFISALTVLNEDEWEAIEKFINEIVKERDENNNDK